MFVIFSGVSGSGKQTVIGGLMSKLPNCEFVKSATTRPRRENENEHYHLTPEEFDSRLKKDEFFESENVHGFMYGILKADLQHVIDSPDTIFFKDVDVHGTEKLVKFLKGKTKVLTIFLDCPDDLLYERLLRRGESEERARIRLERGKMEREYKDRYDLTLQNIDLAATTSAAERAIRLALK